MPTFEISSDDMVKFMRSLDPNKSHVHDEISICMIKTCTSSSLKPQAIIFRNRFVSECFPEDWKKANKIPVH